MKYATVKDVMASFPSLYFQQFRASRITKQSTPPENVFKKTRGQLTPTWVEPLGGT
jgi:hypothetical protein